MNKFKKVFFLTGTMMMIALSCRAQVLKTPEVFSFQQEVFSPVSYYTGQANISIPLTQIRTNEITIPITLNYIGGSGLQAINPYSSVGMGWRLTAGGVITRSKNEVCDESTNSTNGKKKGFFNLTPNSVTNSYVRNQVNSYTYITGNGWRQFDAETEYSPDVFTFNFLGYSGFFVMGYDGEFKIQSQDIASVEKLSNNSYAGINNGIQFKLISNEGVIFYFGSKIGSIEILELPVSSDPECDAWYLTEIEFPNGKNVSFNYQDNSYNRNVRYKPQQAGSPVTVIHAITPVVLSSISFSGGQVIFSSSVEIQNITGAVSNIFLMKKIELKDNENKIIANVGFSQSAENSSRYFFLDDVTVNDKKYTFNYYKRSELPNDEDALGTDYWGFYNGEDEVLSLGVGDVSSYWDMYLNPTVTYPARMPSTEFSKRGILTSIVHPTGDTAYYEYEQNTYQYKGIQTLGGASYVSESQPEIAGGLRIAQITMGGMTRKYRYVENFDPKYPDLTGQIPGSSGFLYRLPGVPYFGRIALNALTIEGEPAVVYSKVIEYRSDTSYTEYLMRSPLGIKDGNNNLNTNYFSVWADEPNIFTYYPEMGFVGSLGKGSSRSLERGQISEINEYDASNTLKKSTTFTYSTDPNRYEEYVAGVNLLGGDDGYSKLGLELGQFLFGKRVMYSIAHSYEIYTFPVYLEQVVETSYEDGKEIEQTTQYDYNAQKLRSATTTQNSNGDVLKTIVKYPADINGGVYASMTSKKMLNFPVEALQLKNNDITAGKLTTYKSHNNNYVPDKTYSMQVTAPVASPSFQYFNGTARDSHYGTSADVSYDTYDDYENPVSLRDKESFGTAYQWAYQGEYPVAEIRNAQNTVTTVTTTGNYYGYVSLTGSTATTSFTTDVTGNITISIGADPGNTYTINYTLSGAASASGKLCVSRSSATCSYPEYVILSNKPAGSYTLQISLYSGSAVYKGVSYTYKGTQTTTTQLTEFFYNGFEEESTAFTGEAFAGRKYHNGNYTIPFSKPNGSRQYLVNYKYSDAGEWKNKTKTFSNNMTLTDGTAIDEVRVYPEDAMMTTYTYDPLIGMTSRNDPNGFTTFYYYDSYGRLILVRDQDRKVLQTICYNYSGQPETCGVYGNQAQTRTVRKNNCSGCLIGAAVSYTVPASTYYGSSQAEANALAVMDLDANARDFANATGTCSVPVSTSLISSNTVPGEDFTVTFYNNCTGVNYTYTLNRNTSNVTLSPQLPTGNYDVTFTPAGGGGVSHLFWVNAFVDYSVTGHILGVDIVAGDNQVRVYQ